MQFHRTVGSKGDAPGCFEAPWGVAVFRGLLVVSEAGGNRVQVLSLDGLPLQVLQLDSGPTGLAVGEDRGEHWLWVVGRHHNKVHVLDPWLSWLDVLSPSDGMRSNAQYSESLESRAKAHRDALERADTVKKMADCRARGQALKHAAVRAQSPPRPRSPR
jgi:hypothetical protein